MATPIIMPKQGQSVESCIITEWYKKKGDKVSPGDTLFSYETDKASFEEEATVEGTLLEIFFKDGDEVPVLTNVAVVGEEGEDAGSFAPDGNAEGAASEDFSSEVPPKEVEETKAESKTDSVPHKLTGELSGKSSGISPRARNRAEKEGVSTKDIKGSGPKGRIIDRDVLAVQNSRPPMTELAKQQIRESDAEAPSIGSGPGGIVTSTDMGAANPVYGDDFVDKPLSNMRKLIAKSMHASLQNSAQLTHHLGADARNVLALRKKVKKKLENGEGTNITINDMVCFAVIKALKKFPQVNAQFHNDSMRLFNQVHLGLAVDTERGLMVPTIKNASDLSIEGLSNQFKAVAAKCHKGNVDPELLAPQSASFTVSNLGNYGVEMFTPVINLPQVAILGVNTIVPRPKDMGDGVYGFVPYMGLSLTYDHRALDGGEATRFLKQIANEIETLEID
ncbi:dihydrolipoamide acetyltransferase family protein [Marinilabilia rubra]|uniref:Dihydrolipoamide acetyltransferase component of pyruvate dehydrogenase complex n=1 Tax=Marinilabilia rubra TaxID=2162893 RepID=A0A2U2B5X5_9BACT|nr:dihydrolipoamide acetyltransferase family protein [Marinilabilia rubra]PWD98479.1 2-oxo acid dehydrogenase subunit E2 [Marinilabilia rubra]